MIDQLLMSFLLLVALAACEDIWRYRISNLLCGGLLLLFLGSAALGVWPVEWISHLAAGIIVFAIGVGIFAARLMGGGDIKLLAVVALWAGLAALPRFLVATCWASVLVVIALLAIRAVRLPNFLPNLPRPHFCKPGAPVPFAVPIAVGVAASVQYFPAFQG